MVSPSIKKSRGVFGSPELPGSSRQLIFVVRSSKSGIAQTKNSKDEVPKVFR